MRTSNDDIVTQYDLHTAEKCGLIKIDLLSIEALDRMRATLDLLVDYKFIDAENKTLKQVYEETIGIYNIDRLNPEMWDMAKDHKINNLFQMEKESGVKGLAVAKPNTVEELASLNSIMRLMTPEKGAKQPLEIYAERKENPEIWEKEMIEYGLNEKARQWLHKWLDTNYGICDTQELLMSMLQDEEIGGHSLLFADKVRKSIAKFLAS